MQKFLGFYLDTTRICIRYSCNMCMSDLIDMYAQARGLRESAYRVVAYFRCT